MQEVCTNSEPSTESELSADSESDDDVEFEEPDSENSSNVEKESNVPLTCLSTNEVREDMWVKVVYEDELFIGKVLKVSPEGALSRCLKKSFRISRSHEMESDDVYYDHVYSAEGVRPDLFFLFYLVFGTTATDTHEPCWTYLEIFLLNVQ